MPTSGWPWMKNATTVGQPIPPVNRDDDRPALKDLFVQHRAWIDQVATELASDPLYDANKHDDLWIVRFLLSHKKNVKSSVKAAKHTLLFRAERKLDEKDIRYFPISKNENDEGFQRYDMYCADHTFQLVVPDATLGVVGFLNLAGIDQNAVVANLSEADWTSAFVYVAEWSHQWADYLSRTTGRLTASIRIVDVEGMSLGGINMECQKRDGKAMKVTEDCYPQMLKSLLVCHSPTFVQALWRILRPVFPRRVVEKTDFIAPHTNEKERARLLKYISLEHLPTRYGGQNSVWPLNLPLPSKLPAVEEECTA